MPDYAEIKSELAFVKYDKLSEEEIAALLEAPLEMAVDVPVGTVEGYLRSRVLMSGIKRFITSPVDGAPTAFVDGLSELMGMLASPHVNSVMMTDEAVAGEVRAVLGGAVAFGLMTPQHMADLLAMGVVTTTRAAQLGLTPDIHDTANEIAAARIWPGVSK